VLTCNWHNWKFDLFTGTNVMGGDALRTYPVEERDGHVYVDLMDPPLEHRRQTVLFNLCDAFDDHDFGRMARELARLQQLDGDPLEAVRAAVGWSCDRFEYGMGHAYAGAADWLTLYEERPGAPEDRLICLLETLGTSPTTSCARRSTPIPPWRSPSTRPSSCRRSRTRTRPWPSPTCAAAWPRAAPSKTSRRP